MFEITIDFFPQYRALIGLDLHRYKGLVHDSNTDQAHPRIITDVRLGIGILTLELMHYGKPLDEKWGD